MGESKFPETSNDKLYGHTPGNLRIFYKRRPLHEVPLLKHQRICFSLPHTFSDEAREIWFYFEDKWVKLTKDTLLNPLNLKLRREFNECLIEYKLNN